MKYDWDTLILYIVLCVIEINNFRGDLTNASSETTCLDVSAQAWREDQVHWMVTGAKDGSLAAF